MWDGFLYRIKCIGVNAEKAKEIFLDFYGNDFPYDKYKEEQRTNMKPIMVPDMLPATKEMEEFVISTKEDLLQVIEFLQSEKNAL